LELNKNTKKKEYSLKLTPVCRKIENGKQGFTDLDNMSR